jgi:glycosyltransferase involved in cell wall biosynthesis
LKNFDLLISTSLWEGLPTILIEAFQLGMPVITSECVGSIDLVGDYLAVGVKFGEIEDYVEKIKYIQNNYSNLSKKVIDCQSKFLKNNFSDSYLLGCYTKVYQ